MGLDLFAYPHRLLMTNIRIEAILGSLGLLIVTISKKKSHGKFFALVLLISLMMIVDLVFADSSAKGSGFTGPTLLILEGVITLVIMDTQTSTCENKDM